MIAKRQIGTSSLLASKLGLGCMSLIPKLGSENEKMIKTALEMGINYFDTADLYGYGWNEELLGNLLKDVRKDTIIATKGGNDWSGSNEGWEWNPSKKYIKSALKASLARLKTDYIDLYQLHGGTIDDPLDETIEALEELVKEGVVRYYGISSIRPNVIQYFAEHSNIQSVMMQFSLLDRRPEELFPYLESKNISVISRGSIAKGWLSERAFIKDSEEKYLSYKGLDIQTTLNKVKNEIEPQKKLTHIALRYVLSHSAVATAVVGASSRGQLLENVEALSSPLSKEERNLLKTLFPELRYETHRI
jgi:aryl-alcohol dehydrogenase-like predicted oxidoreductase